MDAESERHHRDQKRRENHKEFLERLLARKPELRARYEAMLNRAESAPAVVTEGVMAGLESVGAPPMTPDFVLETIVNNERPVLFVRDDWIDKVEVTAEGPEAEELIRDLDARRSVIKPLMPLIGRIDVTGFPNMDFVGTGWLIDTDIVVTNRHVASLVARWDGRKFDFNRGVGGRQMSCSLNTAHEFDDLAPAGGRSFAITEVLYIEPEHGPDIAFVRVKRATDGSKPNVIDIAPADAAEDLKVCVVGYPARAPRSVIRDQEEMKRLYRDRYDVKRAAPGYTMSPQGGSSRHDCTTLGGNSGSVVLDLMTGKAVGLHFAGLYHESNFAVGAKMLWEYKTRKRWNKPYELEGNRPAVPRAPARPRPQPQSPTPPAPTGGAVTVTIPLSITVSLGQPATAALASVTTGTPAIDPIDPAAAEAAVQAFWGERPDGVIAARVGFFDDGDTIGDLPYIAASVPADRIEELTAGGVSRYRGLEVRYLPANLTEQIEGRALVESVDSINYDDDARTDAKYSFDPVEEEMTVLAHVGPEYSWDVLEEFLSGAKKRLVSAMYEFHGEEIKDALEARLKERVALTMVLDNVTFTDVKHDDEEFDRIPVFKDWKTRFDSRFERVVAPEGRTGLISDAYHIKVTVREDDTFWLSSGNWKQGSSQPVISQEQRDNAAEEDLPGNREWHVVVKSKTLAKFYRSHIEQDFKRSRDLGAGDVPPSRQVNETFVDVPVEEAVVLERRPPSRLLAPEDFDGTIKARPLLTPDLEGERYSEAVLQLIRSARKSLLFQIPYIGMPSNPRTDRGYIDELIKALTEKLKTLEDARVLLRAGGSKFSAPTHAAWYFKSKGVDIAERLKSIENHHTKGMIVDGKRVLIGSHNWSKPGVTLNRDASLIFDDKRIAGYFAKAFEIDWERANPIRPRRFVAESVAIQEAVGGAPPAGFRRVPLSELLKEDD